MLPAVFLATAEVPETLIPVLKILADDLVPETLATADFIVRGETITALAKPHRFYLLQPVQEAFTISSGEKQREVRALLEACGTERLLTAVLSRRMARSDNFEVWE